ncbi:serine/threonine protein kinase [Enterocytozoon bieneusi H348]|nr:serine/threonine protein kinase [Enterocytozoon bieneusi H348]|eukprot:XP_002649398.1 serine/threonine protein kinase [Enterocytozoon bieneusi H348]
MKENKNQKLIKDSAMFATINKVLDHNSIKIIESLQRRNKLTAPLSPLSTGKESVVFEAVCDININTKFIDENVNSLPCIVKIFKTSTMFFKNRQKYIENERRFTNFCSTNSRKLIKLWAEKEVRNYKRLNNAGIPSPRPIYLKKNVLIIEMIKYSQLYNVKNSHQPAIQLKHGIKLISTNEEKYILYNQTIQLLTDIYQKANLVHADFSEYNILINENKKLYIIDVGQSIDITHENAFYFLITDICNINHFYASNGVNVISENEIFKTITTLKLPSCLNGIKLNKNSYIPVGLSDIANFEDVKLFIDSDSIISSESDNIPITTEDIDSESDLNWKKDCKQNKTLIKKLQNTQLFKKLQKQRIKEANRERRKNRVMKEKLFNKKFK